MRKYGNLGMIGHFPKRGHFPYSQEQDRAMGAGSSVRVVCEIAMGAGSGVGVPFVKGK